MKKTNEVKLTKTMKNAVEMKKEQCFNCERSGYKSDSCQDKDKSKKCFNCDQFWTYIGGLPTKRISTGQKTSKLIETTKKSYVTRIKISHGMKKHITIDGHKIVALIVTSSEINMIKYEKYSEFGKSTFSIGSILITGLGQYEIKTIGGFRANINTNDVNIQTEVHVVLDSAIQYNIILDQSLQSSTIVIDRDNLLNLYIYFMTSNTINEITRKEE